MCKILTFKYFAILSVKKSIHSKKVACNVVNLIIFKCPHSCHEPNGSASLLVIQVILD